MTSAYILNTKTRAVSEYQDLDVTGATSVGDKLYVAKSDGIYEIIDESDDSAWLIKTGIEDFGIEQRKSVADVYVSAQGDSSCVLYVVSMDDTDMPVEQSYSFSLRDSFMASTRVSVGRGLSGKYWHFQLAGEGPVSFTSMSLTPLPLTRRI
jgi:hypothetical protein